MKAVFATIFTVLALAVTSQAEDVTVTISKVHLCCQKCVTGVEKAIAPVEGAKVTVDKDAGTVVLSGPDQKTVQKAAKALVKAGYFGESSDPSIKISSKTGAKGAKVQTLQVSGVHLCCDKCTKAVNAALKDVPGVTGNTAAKGVKSFTVTGDFTDSDVFAALQKAGLTGKVAKAAAPVAQ